MSMTESKSEDESAAGFRPDYASRNITLDSVNVEGKAVDVERARVRAIQAYARKCCRDGYIYMQPPSYMSGSYRSARSGKDL